MEFSNRSKYDLNNFARSVSRIEFSNRSKYNLNNFDQSVSRVVLYSESDLKERYLRYIASESNYIYSSSSSSESESERSSIYLDSKERLIGEEETEDEDEEEEEQSDVEEVEESSAVDWPSIPSSPTSGPSGSSGWECIGKEADDVRPGNDILRYSALDLDEDERNGVLTDRIVATGQSCLGVCPGTKGYVYTKLVLVQKNIVDISVLQYHRYLQCIDISWNKLEDVSALGYVRHLMHLDVSHNRLCDALKFRAPWFLTDVNYSYNDVKSLDDLSDFWSVKNLNLSHNSITTITGLEKLRYLQNLDLSYNNITCLQNLNHLNIFELNLENNNLSEYDDSMRLSTLPNLKYLNLNNNKFTTLQFLRGVYSVRCMEMKNNAVAELLEVDNMKTMTLLEELDFSCNPITTWPGYRDAVIHSLPALAYLDGEPVTVGEKLSSMLTFEADVRLLAAQNHASLLLASPEIDCDIPPFDEPAHPLFVLVGPTASGKARLLQNIRKTFGNKIVVGVRHTTRNRMEGGCEEDGVDYHFISQQKFNDLLRGGAFLSTVTARGNSCGLSRMELAKAVQMRRMCITEMELEEALTLFLSGVRPCLILAIPESESLHHARLKSKYEGSKLGGAVHIRRRLCDAATPETWILRRDGIHR
ncbi:leucine-rich repeat and guanylate kinase domain-containing protein-like isoform X2 [Periplaneta americana]|uniref:leucine-rich repeat and guanylate kinase domain-containing protein-like isoform X2 n=1 Tax=Periplaneta americana TaxID=6978 RepID=UPI0037E96173